MENRVEYFITDIGVVIKNRCGFVLKSSYNLEILSEESFNFSNPIRIKKNQYSEELNKWFRNNKYKWVFEDVEYKKLDNFGDEKEKYIVGRNIPTRTVNNIPHCFIVMYRGRLYYTHITGNYYPRIQLLYFRNGEFTGVWTNIKNTAPVFNCKTKRII